MLEGIPIAMGTTCSRPSSWAAEWQELSTTTNGGSSIAPIARANAAALIGCPELPPI
jgi:hypothetical protein